MDDDETDRKPTREEKEQADLALLLVDKKCSNHKLVEESDYSNEVRGSDALWQFGYVHLHEDHDLSNISNNA